LIVIASGVVAAFGVPFGLALMALGVPTMWTVLGFALGVVCLSTRPIASVAILAVCGAVCLCGALTLAMPT